MDAKEEITDVDSEDIQHSDPDDPIIMTMSSDSHDQAVKLKQQLLQDSLELCIMELKKLCIREAELTGRLPSDYPLLPGEKLPRIRRRIGAAFKLDEQSIHKGEDSETSSLETKLALQEQIYAAMHRLCQEDHHSKTVKKSRVQQCKREEKKLKELQEELFLIHLKQDRSTSNGRLAKVSAWLDKAEPTSQLSQPSPEPVPRSKTNSLLTVPSNRPLTPTSPLLHSRKPSPSPQQPRREHLHPCHDPTPEYKTTHVQNIWKESASNQHLKPNSHSNSACSSAAATPTFPRREVCLDDSQVPTHAGLRHNQSSSTPSTPEMQSRRGHYISVSRMGSPNIAAQDRSWLQSATQRHRTDVPSTAPEYSPSSKILPMGTSLRHFSNESSSPDHSFPSPYITSPCQEQQCQAHYTRYHYINPPVSQSYIPLRYYRCPSTQPSPQPYRAYAGEERHYDWNTNRMYYRHQPTSPCGNGQYSYWHVDAPLHLQTYGLPYHHVKPTQAPSLREYSLHQNRVSQARWGQSSPSRGFSAASCAYTPWSRMR
ncbi:innate immunity activator protein-like [Trichomycterus rosablanca]|uniref:innate immunity activator protein-like n=1 Tax=Trichomycterus rosablanca TaxID=2290929 RepID=UPI002F353AE8